MPKSGTRPQTCRYEAIAEPFGFYCIFDEFSGHPADSGEHVLIGLPRQDAMLIAHMLNSGWSPSLGYLRSLRLPRS